MVRQVLTPPPQPLLSPAEAHKATREAIRRRSPGSVAPELQPYVGATHFKRGKRLPPNFLTAVQHLQEQLHPQRTWRERMQKRSCRDVMMVVMHLPLAAVHYLWAFVMIGLVPVSMAFYIGRHTRGDDACGGLASAHWSLLCAGCIGAPPVLWLLPRYRFPQPRRNAMVRGHRPPRAAIIKAHTDALLLLYYSDMCWQGSGDEVVHKAQLGRCVFTVYGRGGMGEHLLPPPAPPPAPAV